MDPRMTMMNKDPATITESTRNLRRLQGQLNDLDACTNAGATMFLVRDNVTKKVEKPISPRAESLRYSSYSAKLESPIKKKGLMSKIKDSISTVSSMSLSDSQNSLPEEMDDTSSNGRRMLWMRNHKKGSDISTLTDDCSVEQTTEDESNVAAFADRDSNEFVINPKQERDVVSGETQEEAKPRCGSFDVIPEDAEAQHCHPKNKPVDTGSSKKVGNIGFAPRHAPRMSGLVYLKRESSRLLELDNAEHYGGLRPKIG